MAEFPNFDKDRQHPEGLINPRSVEVPDKEKFLTDLGTLLRAKQSSELVGTFQAGVIPIILDTLARDTSEDGVEIVTALYEMIESVKTYYKKREPKPEEPEAEVTVPVKKPETE
jgi:hypothetical protein